MAFEAVTWAYKELVSSTKLAQMVENIRAHDHRLDASQGAALDATGWTALPFVNSWANFGAPYRVGAYRRTAGGVVHLTGLVRNGTAATAFTLPVGFRPSADLFLPTQSDDGGVFTACVATVLPTGVVTLPTGRNWITLAGLSFPAEA